MWTKEAFLVQVREVIAAALNYPLNCWYFLGEQPPQAVTDIEVWAHFLDPDAPGGPDYADACMEFALHPDGRVRAHWGDGQEEWLSGDMQSDAAELVRTAVDHFRAVPRTVYTLPPYHPKVRALRDARSEERRKRQQ
jgi:hypothetical protein